MNDFKQVKQTNSTYLAVNLRFLRKSKKLSQEEFAQIIGLNRGNIASYENGTAEPKISNLLRIAEFFNIPLQLLALQDLRQTEDIQSISRIQGLCPQEEARIEELRQKAKEFENFLNGIHTCFSYERKKLEQQSNPLPQEAEFFKSHFEQLYNASQSIVEEYKCLLKMCNCK